MRAIVIARRSRHERTRPTVSRTSSASARSTTTRNMCRCCVASRVPGGPCPRLRPMGTRLGVMGGTFDPIHVGHLVTAEEALHQFALDEVVFVPTGRPWIKEHDVVASAQDRYTMTAIGIAPEPRFHVSRLEVDRGGPTYTVDTLRALRDAGPGGG